MDAKSATGTAARFRGFNPRARDGREARATVSAADRLVSIHAPVMDAKLFFVLYQRFLSFNPRARDGREPNEVMLSAAIAVSIHAPVMDANPRHQ